MRSRGTELQLAGSVYFGWANGDFSGMEYAPDDDNQMIAYVRSDCQATTSPNCQVDTDARLMSFGTVYDSSGTARLINTSRILSNGSKYYANTRPWYKTGIDCGRENGSLQGNVCISPGRLTSRCASYSLLLHPEHPFRLS